MRKDAVTQEEALARYPAQVQTDEECGQAWMSIKTEFAHQRFMIRTGLKREEVGVVVNSRTGKAFFQWVHAIPKEMRVVIK